MSIEQVSVFVENKKGALKQLLGILADAEIDLRAFSVADTSDFGIMRMIVPNPGAVISLLKSKGITASKTEVTGCRLTDEPGALYKAVSALDEAGVSVEYTYAFVARQDGRAFVILRVEDNALAGNVLEKAGYSLLCPNDIISL